MSFILFSNDDQLKLSWWCGAALCPLVCSAISRWDTPDSGQQWAEPGELKKQQGCSRGCLEREVMLIPLFGSGLFVPLINIYTDLKPCPAPEFWFIWEKATLDLLPQTCCCTRSRKSSGAANSIEDVWLPLGSSLTHVNTRTQKGLSDEMQHP